VFYSIFLNRFLFLLKLQNTWRTW